MRCWAAVLVILVGKMDGGGGVGDNLNDSVRDSLHFRSEYMLCYVMKNTNIFLLITIIYNIYHYT